MLASLLARYIVVLPPLGVLFYGIVVPAVCAYHVVGAQGDWPGTLEYATVLFGSERSRGHFFLATGANSVCFSSGRSS